MFNGYVLIIALFIVSGIIATAWGAVLVSRARRRAQWPTTRGRIELSEPSSAEDDLLPHIEYSYTVDGRKFRRRLDFPGGTSPTPEFAASYVERYPAGSEVKVHYNPERPEEAALEAGVHGGDWLVLAFGLCTIVVGLLMIAF